MANSPIGNEPWLFTHSQNTGSNTYGVTRRSTTTRVVASATRPNMSGRGPHVAAPTATAVAATPSRATRPSVARVSAQISRTRTTLRIVTSNRTPSMPPSRSTTAYTDDASQLCTTHGSPLAVNVYGSTVGTAPSRRISRPVARWVKKLLSDSAAEPM